MAEIPEGAKKPADRKKAAKDEEVPEAFSFTDDEGNEYTLRPTAENITPGFIRTHRDAEPQNVMFDALEMLADQDTLAVLDSLSWKRNVEVLEQFDAYLESFFKVSLGNS